MPANTAQSLNAIKFIFLDFCLPYKKKCCIAEKSILVNFKPIGPSYKCYIFEEFGNSTFLKFRTNNLNVY